MGLAVVHAKIERAVHDWATPIVECARLRCCGRTFLSVPPGLTPRSRYSDRVKGFARGCRALGASFGRIRKLLRSAGVPVTAEAIARWCRGVRSEAEARLRVARSPEGPVRMRFREGLWLCVLTRTPRRAHDALRRHLRGPFARSLRRSRSSV